MVLKHDVRIEIDALELGGVPAARRRVVASAFQRELVLLIETHGLPGASAPRTVPERTAPPLRLAPTGSPVQVGRALARSVYESLA